MFTRREFLKAAAASGASLVLPWKTYLPIIMNPPGPAVPQTPLPGNTIEQFADAVPNLLDSDHLIVDDGVTQIALEMREYQANILPAGTVPGYDGTHVWAYLRPGQSQRASYIGPVVLAERGVPTEIKYTNLLGNTRSTGVLAYKRSTDQTLHWADPLNDGHNEYSHHADPPAPGTEGAQNYSGPIPAVVHLHGGEVPPVIDGGPDAWFTSDGSHVGSAYYSRDGASPKNYSIYRYPNTQEGALLWIHDHTLGVTRLNVIAGLAGAYLLRDPQDALFYSLPTPFPLVIQDRMFDTNGELFYTAGVAGDELWALNPEHPYWNPEFVGDVIVVNGKSWPYLEVEAMRYTFMFINGSNARAYEMWLSDPVSGNFGPPLWVIGTDGGYLDEPVRLDASAFVDGKLAIMPGERYWVIVDFGDYGAGEAGPNGQPYSGRWLLRNSAWTPYPSGDPPEEGTTDRIMEFRVVGGVVADGSFDPAAPDATLRGDIGQVPEIVRLAGVAPDVIRQLTLNEVMAEPAVAVNPITGEQTAYPGGPQEVLVNNTRWGGRRIIGVVEHEYQMEPIPGFVDDGNGNWLSEIPREGDMEIWEVVNLTADAHPIHLHLVQFQLLNRQNYSGEGYTAAYDGAFPGGFDSTTDSTVPPGAFIPAYGPPLDYWSGNSRAVGGNPDILPYLQGPAYPALPYENGWKDTVIMFPGQVTRIAVRWAPTDLDRGEPADDLHYPFDPAANGQGYVWHCHILDHEDNEMMRPDLVQPLPGAPRTYTQGTDY